MGPFIRTTFEKMKNLKEEINSKLKKEEELLYKISIIKNGKEISTPVEKEQSL